MLLFTDLQSLTNNQHKSVLETKDNFVDLQPPPTKRKERKEKIPAGQRVAGLEKCLRVNCPENFECFDVAPYRKLLVGYTCLWLAMQLESQAVHTYCQHCLEKSHLSTRLNNI